MLYNVPIESLEQRYSKDWNRWFPSEFDALNVEYETIYPAPLTAEITSGSFLDIAGTNYFKAMQIAEISRKFFNGEIKDGDCFFFHDLWFPGLESLAYMRNGLGLDFKIYGILHAGSYDPYDMLSLKGMGIWAEPLELSWFEFIDKIFVATEYHRQLIVEERGVDPEKIKVTGLPIYPDHCISDADKQNIIVFPHRMDFEKQPDKFNWLADRCDLMGWEFIFTALETDNGRDKKKYYDILSRSKIAVSMALQETWGIAMQEAVMSGCIPIVPDRLAYRELYPREFRYADIHNLPDLITLFTESRSSFIFEAGELSWQFERMGSKAIGNMLKEMGLIEN